MNKSTRPIARSHGVRRGITLIEALVALVVISVGMLALAQVQIQLRINAEVSRQRAEAVRIAQEDMENWRAFSRLATTVGKVAYADIVDRARAIYAGQSNANTDFYLAREVTEVAAPGYKIMKVTVDWTTRTGSTEQVVVDSLISETDPTLAAQLAIPPSGTPIRNPLNRNVRIPATAIDLGDNKSGVIPPGANFYFVFSNTDASIIERCTGTLSEAAYNNIKSNDPQADGTCVSKPGYLLGGFVNFDLRNNVSAVSPGTSVCGFYNDLVSEGLLASSPASLSANSVLLDRASFTQRPAAREYQLNVVTLDSTTSPANNSFGVSTSVNPQVVFSSDTVTNPTDFLLGSSGSIVIRKKLTPAAVVATFTLSAADAGLTSKTVSGQGTLSLSVSSKKGVMVIDPVSTLEDDTQYEVVFTSSVARLVRSSSSDWTPATTVTFTTGPAPTLVLSTPSGAATPDQTFVFTAGEQIVNGVGIFRLWRVKSGPDEPIDSFDVGTGLGGVTGGTITVSGSTVTINPGADLSAGETYYFTLETGAVKDLAGNSIAAVTSDNTYVFSVTGAVSAGCPSTPYNFMSVGLSSLTSGVTSECFSDATTVVLDNANKTVGFFCAVYAVDHDGDPATPIQWGGALNVLGPPGWSATSGVPKYTVCRYTDSNGDGTVSNFEHPGIYSGVKDSLTDQNFLVIEGASGSNPCPSDTLNVGSQTDVIVYFTTKRQQPTIQSYP
jgi:Tfp pilus assembly protein PilV